MVANFRIVQKLLYNTVVFTEMKEYVKLYKESRILRLVKDEKQPIQFKTF